MWALHLLGDAGPETRGLGETPRNECCSSTVDDWGYVSWCEDETCSVRRIEYSMNGRQIMRIASRYHPSFTVEAEISKTFAPEAPLML